MRLTDIFSYSFTSIIRNKKNIFSFLLFSVVFILLIGTLYFEKTYINNLDSSINNGVIYRKLIITPNSDELAKYMQDPTYDLGFATLASLDHVQEMYEMKYDLTVVISPNFVSADYSGDIELLYGSASSLPKEIIGSRFSDNDTGKIICPIKFSPSFMQENTFINTKFIKGEELLNKTITLEKEKYKLQDDHIMPDGLYQKDFTIVGLYDNRTTSDFANNCYISPKDMKEIIDVTTGLINRDGFTPMILTVDSIENVESVKQQIELMNYRVEFQTLVDSSIAVKVKTICYVIVLGISLILILLLCLYIKKDNNTNSYNLGILKTFGYSTKDLQKISYCRTMILVTSSLVVAYLVFILLFIIIKYGLSDYFVSPLAILNIYYSPYVVVFILTYLLTSIVNYIFTKKVLKKDALNLLKVKL